ncbi:MAG: pilus assembly FimT family protein [Planctomycetota bacterium]|jgi:type II secretion system protein H
MSQNQDKVLAEVTSTCGPAILKINQARSISGLRGLRCNGFTIVELLIVVVIIAIAAMAAIPLSSSAASTQVRSAAQMIAADLEYAKSMSISRGQSYSVVFDEGAESYRILDQDSNLIKHPVKKGFDYIVAFSGDSRLSKVDLVDADFDGTEVVKFDYLGSPYDGGNNPLNSGSITLQAGMTTLTVNVEAVTGFITVQ